MKRAVALLLSISLLGCFPHNPRQRTYAQLAEGGAIVAGIIMEYFVQTGADCDAMKLPGVTDDSSCHVKNGALGDVGVALIVGGLLGFVGTISTAEDDKKASPMIDIKAKPAESHADLKLPPGVKGNAPTATSTSTTTAASTPAIAAPAQP